MNPIYIFFIYKKIHKVIDLTVYILQVEVYNADIMFDFLILSKVDGAILLFVS